MRRVAERPRGGHDDEHRQRKRGQRVERPDATRYETRHECARRRRAHEPELVDGEHARAVHLGSRLLVERPIAVDEDRTRQSPNERRRHHSKER